FTAFQIFNNHVQMTYYFLFVMGLMALAFLITAIREKALKRWLRATLCFALGGVLGICINASNLYHTWEYSKESMRGKTELTQQTKDAADQTSSGLERSYITAWSYGIGETWSLLVPNVKGGASVPLAADKTAMSHAHNDFAPIYQAFTQYFGEQPGTSGPVYVGAFVLMLFVLGLFIVRGPMKWCLLAATVLSILLSWGKNFMAFTDFFLDYVPMYDKFRTVASILVIAEFTIPLLAMMALKQMVDDPTCVKGKQGIRVIGLSFLLTGGMALLFYLLPDMFFGNYLSTTDEIYLQKYAEMGYIPQEILAPLKANMSEMRQAMFTADALRSFGVIAVGTLVLLVWRWGKIKTTPMVACILALCLADMWAVNKRYLNDATFTPKQTAQQMIPKTQADEQILHDPDLYYRVLDLTVSTFNDNTAAYYHKSVGGYHAAKLRRYQELIEAHLQHEMPKIQRAAAENRGLLELCNGDSLFPVLNMLNTKYVLLATQDGAKVPVMNPWANGNAWFLSSLRYVDNADDELAALGHLQLKTQAVADAKFRPALGEISTPADSSASITLTAYEANRLTYTSTSDKEGVAVFSEIYYPGWTCTVDGEEVPLGRVNYVLRAARIPAGKHEIVLNFDPQSLHLTEAVAYGAFAVLLIVALLFVVLTYKEKQRKKGKAEEEKAETNQPN
ncbi:MAG: YfhO family protein, partial [Bacteroidaceae bacterium]|nr:YfhO family protein [Bacteroidaceae bacterium]